MILKHQVQRFSPKRQRSSSRRFVEGFVEGFSGRHRHKDDAAIRRLLDAVPSMGNLTAKGIAAAQHPGTAKGHKLLADGDGLNLAVTQAGGKSWVLRFMVAGKARSMGLGSFPAVSLTEARQKAADARKLLSEGKDPIAQKEAAGAKKAADEARTFKAMAEAYIAAHGRSWSAVHAAQWPATLKEYVYPTIGRLPAAAVTLDDVLEILRPIWHDKRETASRVRGRIEKVLNFAADDASLLANPARAAVIILKLGKQDATVKHHPALPWRRLPNFIQSLRARDTSNSAKALELVILTAARLSEVRLMTWREIDMDTATWTVPASRMKMRKEHRVPLSPRAMDILNSVKPLATADSDYVFSGQKRGTALSIMSLDMLLRRFNPLWKDRHGELITVHGFRSTFREWCAEQADVPRELAEMALAHRVAGVEGAYQRSDLFMRRRVLMDEWAAYCGSGKPTVIDVEAGWPSQAKG